MTTHPDPRVAEYIQLNKDISAAKRRLVELHNELMRSDALPMEMEISFGRFGFHTSDFPGSLVIDITNAGHFVDSVNFAAANGMQEDFDRGFVQLVQCALGPAVPKRAGGTTVKGPDGEDQHVSWGPEPGRKGMLSIFPDAATQPSFGWHQSYDGKRGLSGGLIWHASSDRKWCIHT